MSGEVSRVFQGSFKGLSKKFQGCFEEVLRVFEGSFKGVSRKSQGCFLNKGFAFLAAMSAMQHETFLKHLESFIETSLKHLKTFL